MSAPRQPAPAVLAGAVAVTCPHCGAEAGEWCNPTRRTVIGREGYLHAARHALAAQLAAPPARTFAGQRPSLAAVAFTFYARLAAPCE